jgi:hypothetical protein
MHRVSLDVDHKPPVPPSLIGDAFESNPAIPKRTETITSDKVFAINHALSRSAKPSKKLRFERHATISRILKTRWKEEAKESSHESSAALSERTPATRRSIKARRKLQDMLRPKASAEILEGYHSGGIGPMAIPSRSGSTHHSQGDASDRGVGKLLARARSRPLPGHHPDHPYECLVFKGGGAKGSIYPGAIRALEDAGIMPYIKRFAGASAGAAVAALLACGLSSDQLFREVCSQMHHACGLLFCPPSMHILHPSLCRSWRLPICLLSLRTATQRAAHCTACILNME